MTVEDRFLRSFTAAYSVAPGRPLWASGPSCYHTGTAVKASTFVNWCRTHVRAGKLGGSAGETSLLSHAFAALRTNAGALSEPGRGTKRNRLTFNLCMMTRQ